MFLFRVSALAGQSQRIAIHQEFKREENHFSVCGTGKQSGYLSEVGRSGTQTRPAQKSKASVQGSY